jgi:Histidine kinase
MERFSGVPAARPDVKDRMTVHTVEPSMTVWESSGVKPSYRARRLLALCAVLIAIATAVPRILTHTPYQRLGVRLEWVRPGPTARVSDIVGPPGRGVLEKNDRLLAVEGVPFTQQYMMEALRKGGWPRGPLMLTIERHGLIREVLIPPLQLTAWQRLRAVSLPLVGVIAAPLVATLLVWRRPDLNVAWVFLWFAILQAIGTTWNLFRFPQIEMGGAMKPYLALYHGLIFWFPASFLHFMTVFPRPRWGRQRTRSVWFWLVALAYATPPILFLLSAWLKWPADRMYLVFQSVALPLGALSLIERYARPARTGWRPMARERLIALVVAVTLLLATAVDALPENPQLIGLFSIPAFRVFYTVLLFCWLGSPLLIAYLVANDPAFDPRRLIVRSLPYALLSGVLAALYLGVVVVSQRLFAAATGEEAVVFNVIAALAVAFAFAPLLKRLQRGLDRLFGRDPQALRRALDQAGRDLLGALDRGQVKDAVEAAIQRGLRRSVAIEWPEQGMPRLIEPDELEAEERSAVESLLFQAGIRLENLSLQEQRAQAERNAVELREAATRAELRALHSQVQPHFLFNALNALSYLTETDPPAAQRFTERLADMLRYTVAAGDRPAALLSDEIAFVEDYLGVARERFENPLSFEYRGTKELLSAAVPPLLLQPLVENSLKHGCNPGTQAMHMALEARAEDGWLTLVFSDDGDCRGNGVPGLGVGLQNLEQRVRRFAGSDASMSAGTQNGGGFAVTMRWRMKAMVAA